MIKSETMSVIATNTMSGKRWYIKKGVFLVLHFGIVVLY